jgi:hypothetical protein
MKLHPHQTEIPKSYNAKDFIRISVPIEVVARAEEYNNVLNAVAISKDNIFKEVPMVAAGLGMVEISKKI